MSDSATPAAPDAPADPQGSAPQTPNTPAAPAATAQPAAAAPVKVDMTPDQLKARLDEERNKAAARAKQEAEATFLKSLGVTNVDEAKAKIEAQKKLEEEKLSELQRRDKAIEELKPKAERASTLEQVVKRQADAELAKLTEVQRAAVQRLAGDDPVKVWDALEVLAPTWASAQTAQPASPAAPPATAAPQPKPIQPGATTMPAPHAPSPTNPQQVTESPLATWERLKDTRPHIAAAYYLQNSAAIIAAQNARSA